MDSKTETQTTAQGTVLGSFDVTLLRDPGGTAHATATQMRSWSERVAREVPLIVGSLLLAQQQMGRITDPARLTAVAALGDTAVAARENRLGAVAMPPTARPAATFRVDLLASDNFRINVEPRTGDMLPDVAGRMVVESQASELLTTLAEPYRTFYREMLEAAIPYWRDRRPSTLEPTWHWMVALPRLDLLTRQGVEGLGEPQRCSSCNATRPAGFGCLHCGAAPGPALTASALLTPTTSPPPVPEATAPSLAPSALAPPVVSPPPVAPAPIVTTRTTPGELPAERTILPAREMTDVTPPPKVNERQLWPLASFPQRLGAFVLDLVSGIVLGAIGGYGVTEILIALGAFGPDDSPRSIAILIGLVVFGLYLGLGWTKGETLGMFLFHLRLLRAGDRSTVNVFRALARGIGSLILVGIALGVFVVLIYIDDLLPFIQGIADVVFRVIAALIALYALWLGSGQQIVGNAGRQTLGDKVADTVVAVRR